MYDVSFANCIIVVASSCILFISVRWNRIFIDCVFTCHLYIVSAFARVIPTCVCCRLQHTQVGITRAKALQA